MFAMDMIKSLSSKPEKFIGEIFFCWQQQMRFWLTEIGLFSVISKATDSSIILSDSSSSSSDTSDRDILCHGHILSVLSDNIYKIFCHTKTAIELWEALELKYGSAEKVYLDILVKKLLNFKWLIINSFLIKFMSLKILSMT